MDANSELEKFKSGGDTEEVSGLQSTPVVELTRTEKGFFRGVFQSRRELTNSKAGKASLTFDYIATNAKVTKKKGDTYPEVKVNQGDKVTIFAPTLLALKFKEIAVGTEVFISYLGKTTDVVKGKKVTSHKFDVRARVQTEVTEDVVDTVPF